MVKWGCTTAENLPPRSGPGRFPPLSALPGVAQPRTDKNGLGGSRLLVDPPFDTQSWVPTKFKKIEPTKSGKNHQMMNFLTQNLD